MAVQFLIGRAGSGKTQRCADSIAEQSRNSPLGPALIWITPPQATFNSERLLVSGAGAAALAGSVRARVVSFARLAQIIAVETGMPPAAPMDDIARIILLEDVLQKNRAKLKLFGTVADRPGFVQKLAGALEELEKAQHTGDSLGAIAAKAGAADDELSLKLHDLGLLIAAWDAALAERRLLDSRLYDQVITRIATAPCLADAMIWIDAFSAMNVQEMQLTVALARRVKTLTVTVLADPNSPRLTNPALPLDELSLFARTEKFYRALLLRLKEAGVAVETPRFLTDNYRFAAAPALGALEQFLVERPDEILPAKGAAKDQINICEAANPEVELHAAARGIRDRVARGSVRYRDIGLIVADLDGRQSALRRVFSHYNIPHFIDQRRPIDHHPLVELLRAAGRWALSGRCTADALALLKTGLTGVSDQDVYAVENYVLEHGIDKTAFDQPWTFFAFNQDEDNPAASASAAQKQRLENVNLVRCRVHALLNPWRTLAETALPPATAPAAPTATAPDAPTGSALARGLYDLLHRANAQKHLSAWIQSARDAKHQEQVLIGQQAWRQTINLLETLEQLLPTPVDLRHFFRLVDAGLGSLTLGLIPPTVDQVLISSVSRSRHPEIKHVYLLGASDRNFPAPRQEDSILTDRQRTAFNNAAPNEIDAGSRQALLDERFFDYVALTRASCSLTISHAAIDAAGKSTGPSEYINFLGKLFPDAGTCALTLEDNRVEQISTRDDLLAFLLRWGRRKICSIAGIVPSAGATEDDHAAALYEWARSSEDRQLRAAMQRAWPVLAAEQPAALDPSTAEKLFGTTITLSVSQLESYGACPLQYFLRFPLGLQPRPQPKLDALNLGTLYHRVMEMTYQRIIKGKIANWPECDVTALQDALHEEADKVAKEIHPELQNTAPEYAHMLARLQRVLGRVLEAQRRMACAGTLRPRATEVSFGRAARGRAAEKGQPGLEIKTPGKRTVVLQGKIDRVDAAEAQTSGGPVDAAVIDYKSRKKALNLSLVLHGVEMQLPAYMLWLKQNGMGLLGNAAQPVGALFMPLQRAVKSVRTPQEAAVPENTPKYFMRNSDDKPRGVIDADHTEDFDRFDRPAGETPQKSSPWYSITCTQNGFHKNCDVLQATDFALLLRYAEWKIAAMGDALADGKIAPHPYQHGNATPCTQCDYAQLCPFDQAGGEYRGLVKLKKDQALEAMQQCVAPAPAAPAGGHP